MSLPFATVSLPTADRRTSYAFYGEGLGLDAIGEPAADGVPEPLQFALTDTIRLMLIPTVGFGWVIGDHEVAERGHSECILTLRAERPAGVDALIERAHQAGGEIVTQPEQKPWGYAGSFADPDGHVWMATTDPVPN